MTSKSKKPRRSEIESEREVALVMAAKLRAAP
jgi:hypothetical protein